ncbi:uncharacterized protein NECHADRAFT_88864 [Fusarium vanettenii 77-13-4]|uniref:Uncharacterized protein n=1 Tax=Fusarium vanettenii (strain ATCC MYA-4622 / CBS 123669 / FGSC 9596 / NRRL 45880 / 77-13-4) TaxID=660122 RepID=C7ZN48_FUSV7|nr:uncharacterized protein NECHADRAFT_88864 [Fusarium vanettenii 77-13-4]EEU34558.1 predicted protein [Fusarium vanettenii 77-13-4]
MPNVVICQISKTSYPTLANISYLKDKFVDGKWHPEKFHPSNMTDSNIHRSVREIVEILLEHKVPLNVLWRENGYFRVAIDRFCQRGRPKLTDTVGLSVLWFVTQKFKNSQDTWRIEEDTTNYQDFDKIVGKKDKAGVINPGGKVLEPEMVMVTRQTMKSIMKDSPLPSSSLGNQSDAARGSQGNQVANNGEAVHASQQNSEREGEAQDDGDSQGDGDSLSTVSPQKSKRKRLESLGDDDESRPSQEVDEIDKLAQELGASDEALAEANKLLAERQKKQERLERVIASINEEISLAAVEAELLTWAVGANIITDPTSQASTPDGELRASRVENRRQDLGLYTNMLEFVEREEHGLLIQVEELEQERQVLEEERCEMTEALMTQLKQ